MAKIIFHTKAINELIKKQKIQLKKAIEKENSKIEKLHREFSKKIIQESVKNNDLKKIIIGNKNLKNIFEKIINFYNIIENNKDMEKIDVKK